MNRHQPGNTILLVILVTSLLLLLPEPSWGAAHGKVTILLLDRLSLTQLSTDAGPFLKDKINTSAQGLITTNTAGTRSPGNTHATLGAGSPAFSDQPGGLALNFDEKWMGVEAGRLYQQLTGDPSFPTGKVIIPRLADAHRRNFSPTRATVPCLLGTVLKKNHLTTAVLGNADLAPPADGPTISHYRFGPWLAADRHGLVDYGDVGPRTLQPTGGVLPWETDYHYLTTKYQEYRQKADFLVLELGDFARLDALNSYLFDRRIQEERQRLFERLDQFLQELWPLLDWDRDLLLLLAPTPSLTNLKQGAYLTPCLVWGKAFPPGLLTSPTTRQPGLVANVDLAPTIFHFFNLETPAYVTGRVMTTLPHGDFSTLLQMEKKINTTSLFRRKVIPIVVNTAAFIFPWLLLGAGLRKKLPLKPRLSASFRARLVLLPLFLSTLPLSLHLASQLPLYSLWGFIFAVFGFALLFTVVSWGWARRQTSVFRPLIFPLLLFVLFLAIDLLSGAAMIKTSVLGYDPMLGARYYGIGNELAGLLLGSILGSFIFVGQQNKVSPVLPWAFWLFLGSVVILATPRLGANFGGGVTALAMALLLLTGHRRAGQWYRHLPFYLLVLLLFTAILLTSDFLLGHPEDQSHFGQLLNDYRTRGVTAIGEIILRKLQVNIRLISSRWTWLLLSAFLTFIISSLVAPVSFRPFLYAALGGGVVGLLFNDSGLVFSALFFYPLATTGLLIMLVQKEE